MSKTLISVMLLVAFVSQAVSKDESIDNTLVQLIHRLRELKEKELFERAESDLQALIDMIKSKKKSYRDDNKRGKAGQSNNVSAVDKTKENGQLVTATLSERKNTPQFMTRAGREQGGSGLTDERREEIDEREYDNGRKNRQRRPLGRAGKREDRNKVEKLKSSGIETELNADLEGVSNIRRNGGNLNQTISESNDPNTKYQSKSKKLNRYNRVGDEVERLLRELLET